MIRVYDMCFSQSLFYEGVSACAIIVTVLTPPAELFRVCYGLRWSVTIL